PITLNLRLYANAEPVWHKDSSGYEADLAQLVEEQAIETEITTQEFSSTALKYLAEQGAANAETSAISSASRTALAVGVLALTALKSDEKDDEDNRQNRGSIQIQGND